MRLIKARSDLSKPRYSISIRTTDDRSLVRYVDGPEIAINFASERQIRDSGSLTNDCWHSVTLDTGCTVHYLRRSHKNAVLPAFFNKLCELLVCQPCRPETFDSLCSRVDLRVWVQRETRREFAKSSLSFSRLVTSLET